MTRQRIRVSVHVMLVALVTIALVAPLRAASAQPQELPADYYQLQVGDTIDLISIADENLDRDLIVLPDGTITVRLLGNVQVAGLTIGQVQGLLEERYKRYYKTPGIVLTPFKVGRQHESEGQDLCYGSRW